MKLDEMMKKNRTQELKAVYKFIDGATIEEIASIIEEIRIFHDNILVFNQKHKSLDGVESVSINGECIQLNLEES